MPTITVCKLVTKTVTALHILHLWIRQFKFNKEYSGGINETQRLVYFLYFINQNIIMLSKTKVSAVSVA